MRTTKLELEILRHLDQSAQAQPNSQKEIWSKKLEGNILGSNPKSFFEVAASVHPACLNS